MTDTTAGVSRRDFMKQSAALAGGVLATGDVTHPARAAASDDQATTQDVASHLTLWYRRPARTIG